MISLKEGLLNKNNIKSSFNEYYVMVPIEKDWMFVEYDKSKKFQNYKYDFPRLDIWIFNFRDFAKLFNDTPEAVAKIMSNDESDIFVTNKKLDDIIEDFRSQKFYDVGAIYKDKNYKSLRYGTA